MAAATAVSPLVMANVAAPAARSAGGRSGDDFAALLPDSHAVQSPGGGNDAASPADPHQGAAVADSGASAPATGAATQAAVPGREDAGARAPAVSHGRAFVAAEAQARGKAASPASVADQPNPTAAPQAENLGQTPALPNMQPSMQPDTRGRAMAATLKTSETTTGHSDQSQAPHQNPLPQTQTTATGLQPAPCASPAAQPSPSGTPADLAAPVTAAPPGQGSEVAAAPLSPTAGAASKSATPSQPATASQKQASAQAPRPDSSVPTGQGQDTAPLTGLAAVPQSIPAAHPAAVAAAAPAQTSPATASIAPQSLGRMAVSQAGAASSATGGTATDDDDSVTDGDDVTDDSAVGTTPFAQVLRSGAAAAPAGAASSPPAVSPAGLPDASTSSAAPAAAHDSTNGLSYFNALVATDTTAPRQAYGQVDASTGAVPLASTNSTHVLLAVRIAGAVSDGSSTVTVELHPAELGKVEVHLTFHTDGVDVKMNVARPETFESLNRKRASLEQQLAQAGIDLGGGGLDLRYGQQSGQSAPRAASARQRVNLTVPLTGVQAAKSTPLKPISGLIDIFA